MENVILSPVPLSNLEEMITACVQEAIAQHRQSLIPIRPHIVDGETLEKELGVTRQTLATWRKRKRIPWMQEGAVIRYDLLKVIKALEKKKRGIAC